MTKVDNKTDIPENLSLEDDHSYDFIGRTDKREITAEVCELADDAIFCKVVKGLTAPNCSELPQKSFTELKVLPTRQYLDQVLVPILMRAIAFIAKIRPPSAIKAFAMYLLKHRAEYESTEDDMRYSTESVNTSSTEESESN